MLSSRRLREFVLLTLGVITPIGILAVNASAFVMTHLQAFRFGIAGCALLSGLVLNGLTAWWLLRLASRTLAHQGDNLSWAREGAGVRNQNALCASSHCPITLLRQRGAP